MKRSINASGNSTLKNITGKQNDEDLWKGFDVDFNDGDYNWLVIIKSSEKIGYNGWHLQTCLVAPKND